MTTTYLLRAVSNARGPTPSAICLFFISQGQVCSELEKRSIPAFSAHPRDNGWTLEDAYSTKLVELLLCQCACQSIEQMMCDGT